MWLQYRKDASAAERSAEFLDAAEVLGKEWKIIRCDAGETWSVNERSFNTHGARPMRGRSIRMQHVNERSFNTHAARE